MSQLKNSQNPIEIFPSGLLAFSINGMREIQITEVTKVSLFDSELEKQLRFHFNFEQAIRHYAQVNPLVVYTEGQCIGEIDNLPNPFFIYGQEYVSCILTKEGVRVWNKPHSNLDFQKFYEIISTYDGEDYTDLENLRNRVNAIGFDIDYDLGCEITSMSVLVKSPL